MANFVSTTIGASDPTKAMNIKALEKRQSDLMAAMQKQGQPSVADLATPWQGAGHVVNQIADQMNVNRIEAKADAARTQLSQLMSGYNPDSPEAMKTVGRIMALSPELGGQLMTQFHDSAKQRALFGQQDKMEAAKVEAAKAAAEELARVNASAASDQAAKEHSLEQARARDQLILQQQKAEDEQKKEKLRLDAEQAKELSDPKRILAEKGLEKEAVQERQLVEELGRAEQDINHPQGIFTGPGAALDKARGNAPWGIGGYIGDPEKAARTSRFDTTMEKVATTNMSQILKGASTDFEMKKFITLWNSPTATLDQKREAFRSVLAAAKQDQAIGEAALARLGNKRLIPGGPQGATAPATGGADPLTEAQNAINAGAPLEEVAKIFQSKGGDPSMLKPKGG